MKVKEFLDNYYGIKNVRDPAHHGYFSEDNKTVHLRFFLDTYFSNKIMSLYSSPTDRQRVLILAADKGDLEALRNLCELPGLMPKDYINLIENQKGFTAIMMAAARGHTNVVEYLLSLGANPEAKNKAGANSYVIAARFKKKDVLIALYQHSGSPKRMREVFMQLSHKKIDKEALFLLKEHVKLNFDARANNHVPTLLYEIADKVSRRWEDNYEYRTNPDKKKEIEDDYERMKLLLELGASPNAIYEHEQEGQIQFRINPLTGFPNIPSEKDTPLDVLGRGATVDRRYRWYDLLLAHGANPNNLFQICLRKKHYAGIHLFLSYGARPVYTGMENPIHAKEYITNEIIATQQRMENINKDIAVLQKEDRKIDDLEKLESAEIEYLNGLDRADMFYMGTTGKQLKVEIHNKSIDERYLRQIESLSSQAWEASRQLRNCQEILTRFNSDPIKTFLISADIKYMTDKNKEAALSKFVQHPNFDKNLLKTICQFRGKW